MKKILGILALAALAFTSCSKDRTIDEPNDQTASAMSFTFNKPQGAYVTYAEEIASAEEWFIDRIDVYAAIDGTVTKLTDANYTLTESTRAYTVTMKQEWVVANAGKTANFYFLGNDEISTCGPHEDLQTMGLAISEANFRDMVTDILPVSGDPLKMDLIEHPNGSDRGLLFSAVVENVKIEGKIGKSTQLKRREARFDIKNPLHAGDVFVVTEILVSNASANGKFFPNADLERLRPAKASHKPIPGPTTYDADDMATSVFYLYPTEMGTGVTDTEITVMGKFNGGDVQPYTVNASSVSNLIEANRRYILALNPTTMTFALEVVDYEEGGEMPAEIGEDDDLTLGNFKNTGDGVWEETSLTYDFTAATDNVFTFDATSKYGSEVGAITYEDDQKPSTDIVVKQTGTKITYAGYQTVDSYRVSVPADADMGFRISVTIKARNGAGEQTLYFNRVYDEGGDVLYFAEEGVLSVGRIGEDFTTITDIAYFTLGGVIGSAYFAYSATAVPDYRFCPVPEAIAPTQWASIPALGDLMEYSGTAYDNLSANDYHNLANVQMGVGDPCRLVGMNHEDIWLMTTDDELYALEAQLKAQGIGGWRLPTGAENSSFFFGDPDIMEAYVDPSNSSIDGVTKIQGSYYQKNGSSEYNPDLCWVPVIAGDTPNYAGHSLPMPGSIATGIIMGTPKQGVTLLTIGFWPSSTFYEGTLSCVVISENGIAGQYPNTNIDGGTGTPVRCVRK